MGRKPCASALRLISWNALTSGSARTMIDVGTIMARSEKNATLSAEQFSDTEGHAGSDPVYCLPIARIEQKSPHPGF